MFGVSPEAIGQRAHSGHANAPETQDRYIAHVISSGPLRPEPGTGVDPCATVTIEFTKYDGRAHWHFPVRPLGADEHGKWYGAYHGVELQRGQEPPVSWGCDFVVLVPAAGEWIGCFNSAGKFAIYIDVTGPISISDGRVTAVDLDLDVVRLPDGGVELLDEDEFIEHQVRFGYPSEVVERAEATANWLLHAVRSRQEPFDTVGPSWLSTLLSEATRTGSGAQPDRGVRREQIAFDRS